MGDTYGDRAKDNNYARGYFREKPLNYYTKPNKLLAPDKSSNWEIRYKSGTHPAISIIWDQLKKIAAGHRTLSILLLVTEPHMISFQFKKINRNQNKNNLKKNIEVKDVVFVGYGPTYQKKFYGIPGYSFGGEFTPIHCFSPFSFDDINGALGNISWQEANLIYGISRAHIQAFTLSNLLIDSPINGLIDKSKPATEDNMRKFPKLEPNQFGWGLQIAPVVAGVFLVQNDNVGISGKPKKQFKPASVKDFDKYTKA